jgi:hypothetical protein
MAYPRLTIRGSTRRQRAWLFRNFVALFAIAFRLRVAALETWRVLQEIDLNNYLKKA